MGRWSWVWLVLVVAWGCSRTYGGIADDDSATDDDDDTTGDDDSADDDDTTDDDDSAPDDDDSVPDDDDTTPEPTTTLATVDDVSNELLLVDEVTGQGTPVVAVDVTGNINSIVFLRDGSLYGNDHEIDQLVLIDPCTGSVTPMGTTYSVESNLAIPGLATNDFNDLFGVEVSADELVAVDKVTGQVAPIGPLGVNFNNSGLTWDAVGERFLAINGVDDALYSVDPATGAATWLVDLDLDFGTVGIELDPVSGVLYAATGPNLLQVNVLTGHVEVIGPIGEDDGVGDLGATFFDVPCL